MGSWSVTLYATNTLVTGSPIPVKTAVETATDAQDEYTVTLIGANAEPNAEGENRESLAGTMRSKSRGRFQWTLKLYPKSFPSTETFLETLYHTNLLTKRYHYIYWNTYPLLKATVGVPETATCQQVALTGYSINHDYESGLKFIEITLDDSIIIANYTTP